MVKIKEVGDGFVIDIRNYGMRLTEEEAKDLAMKLLYALEDKHWRQSHEETPSE